MKCSLLLITQCQLLTMLSQLFITQLPYTMLSQLFIMKL